MTAARARREPAARQADNLVERARFLEEAAGAFRHGDALLE